MTRALTVLTGCNFMPSKKRREMSTGRGKAFTFRILLPFFMAQEDENKIYLTGELFFFFKEGKYLGWKKLFMSVWTIITDYLANRSVSHGRSRGATPGVLVGIAAIYIIRLYSLLLLCSFCVKKHSWTQSEHLHFPECSRDSKLMLIKMAFTS